MERLILNNQKVKVIINKADEKSNSQLECIKSIDLAGLSDDNLGEAKYFYDKCMKEKGYAREDFTVKNLYSFNL